ncbi:uncharacterized protein ATNIH1004_000889 [Aspergillus tanneri]|uniref:Uncharacterized protein n=1 Tax=Aspergillus tanneri TaxID=1220188 RepID=A0A5M9N4P3_9EURO|nr:uncharacterized protein ATNIH1004_000889 [Aspergillus tanneri]KAA8651989.1 hypothetical protein ATNIH1004_000889 [Aspergillus tanneri]
MRRSGIHKSGAIPFLVLLVFSLLSFVPSLAKEWDWDLYSLHVGYIGYQRREVWQVPHVKDDSIGLWSRLRRTDAQCQSWMIDGSSQKPRPRRAVLDTPSRSSFETASVYTDWIPYVGGSPNFTRGTRALKAFIKQLGSLKDPRNSTGSASFATCPSNRMPSFLNTSLFPMYTGSEKHLPRLWQQVCQSGNDYLHIITQYALREKITRFSQSASHNSTAFHSLLPNQPSPEAVSPDLLANDSSVGPSASLLTRSPNSAVTTAGQSKNTGFGQHSEHTRGSCMAIVIALVAGVMWF